MIAPMLAKPGTLPRSNDLWGYEVKWDGIRALVTVGSEDVRVCARSGKDRTHHFPELQGLAGRSMVLDGEIIAVDAQGRPSFSLVQQRATTKLRNIPITYMVFDILELDGVSTQHLSYRQRRNILDAALPEGASWQVSPMYPDGQQLLDATKNMGLEGIIAKRLGSRYQQGRRSPDWLKIKNQLRQEFVICGYTDGEGSRQGRVGAVVLGYYDDGKLVYAGKAGTGFTDAQIATMTAALDALRIPSCPFSERPKERMTFVRPELVAEVEFHAWTADGVLRFPSFKGLRDDKQANEVVRET